MDSSINADRRREFCSHARQSVGRHVHSPTLWRAWLLLGSAISCHPAIWAIADWHERECYDLVGVHFTDHPNLKRILCPEDWEGHPLRKDYDMPLEYHGVRGK